MTAAGQRAIRVVLADDDPLVRSALSLLLGGASGIDVVGEAGNGAEALEAVRVNRPDVTLMDIRMPVMDGLEATRRLVNAGATRVIVLTTFDADEQVLEAVAAGADGFLVKDTPPADLVSAIRKVAAGEAMLSPSATRAVVSRLRGSEAGRREKALHRVAALTQRESEVALRVGRGLSNADIAAELYLSVPTVKAHVSRVMDKLDSTNRVQVAICMHDAGLL